MSIPTHSSTTNENRQEQVFVRADDGCLLSVHILQRGREGFPPILMVHALAMDASMWRASAAALPAEFPVVVIDCRGHGDSDKPAGPYSVEGFAGDLLNVLDALRYERAIVVGCSMGGTVALAFAGRHSERTAGLVAIDTTAWYGENALLNWSQRGEIALRDGMQALIDFQCERWFSPDFRAAHPAVVAEAISVFLKNDTTAYAQACSLLGRADERAAITAYRGPAVVMVGAEDYATPLSMAQEIVSRIPQAKLIVVCKARHYTPLEAPNEIAAAISELGRTVVA